MASVFVCFVFVLIYTTLEFGRAEEESTGLRVLTIAERPSDGLNRFLRSAKVLKYQVQVLGEGEGDLSDARKIELMREALAKIDDPESIVLVTVSEDAVFSAPPSRLLEEFTRLDAGILVSSDGFCWPDLTLEFAYPKVGRGKRFLNSGSLMGKVSLLQQLLSDFQIDVKDSEKKTKEKEAKKKEVKDVRDLEDGKDNRLLQVLLTAAYLKEATRTKYNIKIDHRSDIFQNLNGATADVELRFAGKDAYVQNVIYNTVPILLRGNRHTKVALSTLGSYLARAWSPEEGCRACWDDMRNLENVEEAEMPRVTMAIFIEHPTPFLTEFLAKVKALKYPKSRMHLYVHNDAEYHEEEVRAWVKDVQGDFEGVKVQGPEDKVKEWHARNSAVDFCLQSECEFLFSVDGEAHLDNPFMLKLLIEQNREVVAPMLLRPHKAWSNFWGAVTSDGFYARSADYMEIVQNLRRGLWNVPYVSSCYLLQKSLLEDTERRPSYIHNLLDPDMAFCENMREKGVFMYVSNRVDFGHLVSSDTFDTSHLHNELWQIFENRWDWEQRYLHPNYTVSLNQSNSIAMPCPDVFWFPVFTERFAKEIIDTMEDFGTWSDGSSTAKYRDDTRQIAFQSVGLQDVWREFMRQFIMPMQQRIFIGYINDDPRLEGGYESVPTIDIHMKQVGYEAEWLEVLRGYVQPLQLRAFQDYNNDIGPPRALMNFVVRYKPDEQPFLRPHHDTSTYTINVALNRPGIDFKGGGCRFVRYNCSVVDTRVGWLLMHPGRLTHLHEGLRVTEGTRYIIVSFVDP